MPKDGQSEGAERLGGVRMGILRGSIGYSLSWPRDYAEKAGQEGP